MPTPTTDRINSIIEQWVMLITDMNLNITAMGAAMPELGQVRRRMQSAVAKMVGTKEEMETSLGSLLELARTWQSQVRTVVMNCHVCSHM